MKISKTFTFDAAHQLPNHIGKCKNLHGHTYRLEVIVCGEIREDNGSSSEGMILDFGILKGEVKSAFLDAWDHAFLARGDEKVLPVLQETGQKVVITGQTTTAENLAMMVLYELYHYSHRYRDMIGSEELEVVLHETPTSAVFVDSFSFDAWIQRHPLLSLDRYHTEYQRLTFVRMGEVEDE